MEKHNQLWPIQVEKTLSITMRSSWAELQVDSPSPSRPRVQLRVDEKLQGLIITAAIVHLQNN